MTWEVKITVFRDAAPHLSASFDRSPITLGARPYNDIVLNDPFVSGEHAQVMVSRGELVVRDHSRNGSFFDGRRIEEQSLGQRGRVTIPPFEVELSLEIEEEDTWKTAYRSDLSDLLPAPRPSEAGPVEDPHPEVLPPGVRPPGERPPGVRPPGVRPPGVRPPGERPPGFGVRPPPPPGPPEDRPSQPSGVGPALGPPGGKPTLTIDTGDPVSRSRSDRETLSPGKLPLPPAEEPAAEVTSGPREMPAATAAHDRFHLRVLSGPPELQDRIFALPPRSARIGRGNGCDIRLPVETVSRSHAVLHPLAGDACQLVDAGSANGCFVGGDKVEQAELADGDEFRLGDIDLQLFLGGSAVEPPALAQKPPPIPGRDSEQPPRPPVDLEGDLRLVVERVTDDPSAVVIEIAGRVDSYNYTQVADALDGAIGDGARFLVVDLSGVHFIGHTGLGVLVKSLARLKPLRGDLRLVGLSQRLLDALSMSHLDSLFQQRLAASRQEALAAWIRS